MPKQDTEKPRTRSVPIDHRQQQSEQVPNVIFIPLNHSSASSLSTSSSSSSSSLSAYPLNKWTIPPQGLPPPPVWLERSTLTCCHQKQPQEVLDDIAAFLRPTIVECYYDENKITCRYSCSLQFVIYLWLDNNNHSKERAIVLVELQRRQGCAILFHHIKQQLFLTLQQQQQMATNTTYDTLQPMDLSRNHSPTRSWIQKQTDQNNNNDGDNATDTLSGCQRLLCENFMAGMEQILFLVVHHPTSAVQFVSGTCQDSFRQLMAESLQSPAQTSYRYDMSSRRRRLALHILVMVLAQLSNTSMKTIQQLAPSKRRPFIDLDDLFWQNTVLNLRDCIHDADCHPQEATLAIQCLRHLYVLTSPPTGMNDDASSLSLSSLDELLFQDEGFLVDLQRAHVLGRIHHQPLATEVCRLVEYYGESTM